MKKIIGEKIRILRLKKGYTQIALAESVKISESTYRSIEAGKTTLDITILHEITKELEVDFVEFISDVQSS